MPAHDWTRVEAGLFHAFHTAWIGEIQGSLNRGLLPEGYYALAEQHAGEMIADILTLHASPPPAPPFLPPITGGTALAEAPPRVRRRQLVAEEVLARRRSLAIRHVTEHRLVALIEIVSPANKDRAGSVQTFANKAASALKSQVHLLIVDLFPPGPNDPHAIQEVILQHLRQPAAESELPEGEPRTLAAYASGPRGVEVFLEPLAVGAPLPDMPLFLRPDRYIDVPLEATYLAAYEGMPAFWRDVLEGRSPE